MFVCVCVRVCVCARVCVRACMRVSDNIEIVGLLCKIQPTYNKH